ncbi:hypothetical protein [Bradyrhizobium sp. DASA03007]|uniref:hypothetical protein n=1 Tax=unclassified Bradyrhizobium TaxID=2631580 RepID=UPI003F714B9F
MIELYWMALLRDVNFLDYPSNALAQAAASELSALKLYAHPDSSNHPNYTARPVTPATLFEAANGRQRDKRTRSTLGRSFHNFSGLTCRTGLCGSSKLKGGL